MVSHDLKNPLNTIRLLANNLKTELREDSHDGVETLHSLIQETQRSSAMVEELLDMAALDMGKIALKRVEMDVSALVAAVVFMQSSSAEQKEQSITMQLPPECVIKGDEARLRQVIENLISNAVKFSPHGTKVNVCLTAPDEKGLVRFSVQDEGPGLTDDDKSKVFGHFQKLSARPTGDEHSSGIGLAIVKQIVELHGGHIAVESEVGKGATFVVELPVQV
jgi:signal transduction histidine kinase